jgi:hypothetical protein
VAFVPGATELAPKEATKLDHLAKALFQRPQLKLEIVGRFDPVADDAALRRAKFETERRGFEQALPGNAEFVQLAAALKMANPPTAAELTTLLYVKTFAIPFQLPTNSLNSAATVSVTNTTTASSGTPAASATWLGRTWKSVGDSLAWKGGGKQGKQPGSSSTPVSGAGTNRQPATDPTKVSTTPVTEPPPVLPSLPELKAMEAKLIERQAVTPEEMQALAASRAQAVQAVLLAKPELTPERIVVAPELSGAEPAGRQARVFLGIQ